MPPTFNGRVLIVEDEPSIAETLSIALDLEGFSTEMVRTGKDALKSLESDSVAFLVLDVGLPDQTGFDVLRLIRQKYNVPVLMLTARSEEVDRVVGLELGADDYVTKPFSPREVVSRIKAILRRWSFDADAQKSSSLESEASGSESSAEHLARPGRNDPGTPQIHSGHPDFRTDEESKLIYYRGKRLPLSPYEYATLHLLLQRPGMVFSREVIMDHVWSDPEDSFDRAVDTVIKNIRNAIRGIDSRSDPIETRRGLGYCIRID